MNWQRSHASRSRSCALRSPTVSTSFETTVVTTPHYGVSRLGTTSEATAPSGVGLWGRKPSVWSPGCRAELLASLRANFPGWASPASDSSIRDQHTLLTRVPSPWLGVPLLVGAAAAAIILSYSAA